MTPALDPIITAFEAKEAEADKVRGPDHAAIAEAVARELGIPVEDVRKAMIDHWTWPMRAG